jgi:ribosomal protein S18 acetylase RimI-like enzyme
MPVIMASIGMNPPFALRDVQEQDSPFLLALFKTARAFIFDRMPLPEPQKEALIRQQFEAQRTSYKAQFPGSQHSIILSGDTGIGQIWIARSSEEYRIVDVSVVPEYRNRGIGSNVVRQFMAEAAEAGLPLRCTVQWANPGSLRFHQRLGFQIVSQDLADYALEYRPLPGPAQK